MRQVLGMDGIQVGLTVGHDGVGRHADQVLYAGTDVAEPQLRQAAFQAVDGAAGQVVGQGFEAHACVLAFGQVLQRAAERDDAALLVAQGAAHEAGREPPSVRAVVHDIEAVGLAGADAQLHGSGEPGKILRSEHGAQGMARQRRTLGVQAVHHIHHLRGLEVLGVQLPCPAAQARQLFGLAQHVVAFLQLGLGLAHEGDVARNAQHAHGPALVIAVRNFGGLEEAALPVDQQMILRHHGGVAVQHPAVAVGEAAVGEQFLVGLAHDVFGRAPGKARGGGVDEGVAALPVLGEDQVGRFVHHGFQQARRILPWPGTFSQERLQLRIGLADRLVLAGALAELVPGGEEKPPARQRLAIDMELGGEAGAVAADQSAAEMGLAVHGHVLPGTAPQSVRVGPHVHDAQPQHGGLVMAQAGAGMGIGIEQAALLVKQKKTVGHTVQELAIRRIGHEDS